MEKLLLAVARRASLATAWSISAANSRAIFDSWIW